MTHGDEQDAVLLVHFVDGDDVRVLDLRGHLRLALEPRAEGRDGGVLFIPPQVAEQVVQYSEITHLRDLFGHQRLREGKYTAGQIDTRWTAPIEADFTGWLSENIDKLPVAKEQIEEILKRGQR